jgi:hypothetical protein
MLGKVYVFDRNKIESPKQIDVDQLDDDIIDNRDLKDDWAKLLEEFKNTFQNR